MNKHKVYAVKSAPDGMYAILGTDEHGNDIVDLVVFIILADEIDNIAVKEKDAKEGFTTGLIAYFVTYANLGEGSLLFEDLSTNLSTR